MVASRRPTAGLNSSRRARRVRYWIKAVTFPRVNKSRGAGSFLCLSPSVRHSRTGRIRSAAALLHVHVHGNRTGQSNSSHFESQREPLVTLDSVKLNVNTVNGGGGRVLPVRLSPKTGHETTSPNSFPLWNSRRRGGMVDSKQSFRAPIPIPSEFPPFPPQLERDIKRGRHDFLRISNEKTLLFFFFSKVYVDRAVKNNK